jgi:DNA repair photolyase
MVDVVVCERKSPVLTPSSIPCLRRLPTINITAGCALACTYCYIQGYSGYPGSGRVLLYENTPELVAQELMRKRKRPRRVYFSPSSDAFQYLPRVQAVSLRTMTVLLEAGVEVAFLTKGFVTPPFLRLFGRFPQKVFAQIGITTLDRALWRQFEPRTAPPKMRLEFIRSLLDVGVETTARLDPLIPDISDTSENLSLLLERLAAAGIREAAASYLFLRPAISSRLSAQLDCLRDSSVSLARWSIQAFADGGSCGRMINFAERERRFANIQQLAHRVGVQVRVCRCKNPEFAEAGCHIAGPDNPASNAGIPLPLFTEASGYRPPQEMPVRAYSSHCTGDVDFD